MSHHVLLEAILATVAGALLWLSWRMRWERDQVRTALRGVLPLLPAQDRHGRWAWAQPDELDDVLILMRLDCADAALQPDFRVPVSHAHRPACCCAAPDGNPAGVSNCCPIHNLTPAQPAPGCWCRT